MSSEVESSFLDTTLSSDEQKSKADHVMSRAVLERRQLLHNMELLKLNISVKDNQLQEMKNAHAVQVEDVEEKLADSRHRCQLLEARLNFCSQSQQGEVLRYEQRLKALELNRKEQEDANSALQHQLANIMLVCHSPLLSTSEFEKLKSLPPERLTSCQQLQIAIYGSVSPAISGRDELSRDLQLAEQRAAKYQEEALRHSTLAQKEAEQRLKIQTLCTELQEQLERHVLAQISAGKEHDFRVLNYDDVAREKTEATQRCQSLQSQVSSLESRLAEAIADVAGVTEKLSASERQIELLQKDKAYLSDLVATGQHQQHLAEDRLGEVRQQLRTSNSSLEAMQNVAAAEREQRCKEWSEKLDQELGAIRTQTAEEIQRIRSHSAAALERETRLMKDALERSQLERDNANQQVQALEGKHQALLLDFQRVESTSQHQISECQHELQLRVFELERLRVLHADCASKQDSVQLEAAKLAKQLELVKEELQETKHEAERRVIRLEMDCRSHQQRLEVYTALEKELEETLEEAAEEVDHDDDRDTDDRESEENQDGVRPSPRLPLAAPGHFTPGRHWQNRLSVARRLLQSDRVCVTLRRQLAQEKETVHRLKQEVESSRALLEKSHQPMSVLIQGMQSKDEALHERNQQISHLRLEMDKLAAEHRIALKEKVDLMADLERLVHQQETFVQLRDTIATLQQQRRSVKQKQRRPHGDGVTITAANDAHDQTKTTVDTAVLRQPVSTHRHRAVQQDVLQSADPTQLAQPTPTIFTKKSSTSKARRRHGGG